MEVRYYSFSGVSIIAERHHEGEQETEKSVKGSIRKIPSESVIRLWRNFFVMADDFVWWLEEALLRLPFSK